MKREAFDHPKFRLLGRDLRIPMCYVRGIMESLWLVTGRNFPQGDVGRWSNEEIAVAIDYPGDADELVNALMRRRLVDEIPDGRLYVHDWHEHADQHVQATIAKAGLYFANGAEPQIPHDLFNAGARERIKAEYDKRRYGTSPAEERGESRTVVGPVPVRSGLVPDVASIVPDESRTSPDLSRYGPGQVPSIPVPEPVPVPEPDGKRASDSCSAVVGPPAEKPLARPPKAESGLTPAGKLLAGPPEESPPPSNGQLRHTRAAIQAYFAAADDGIVGRVLQACQRIDPQITDEECGIWCHAVMPEGGVKRSRGPAWFERVVPEELGKRLRDVWLLRSFVRGEFTPAEAGRIIADGKADWRLTRALRAWLALQQEAAV